MAELACALSTISLSLDKEEGYANSELLISGLVRKRFWVGSCWYNDSSASGGSFSGLLMGGGCDWLTANLLPLLSGSQAVSQAVARRTTFEAAGYVAPMVSDWWQT